MTRPQIHAYALSALLLLVVALTVALAMLGHATMSGGPQWSAGTLAGAIVVLAVAIVVALAVGIGAVGEWLGRGRTPEPNAGLWFVEPESAVYDPHAEAEAFWAQYAGPAAVHELDEARVDELVRQRSHQRHARNRQLTHHGH